ncbi:MAG: Hsp20/alpha crystallin family protein [Chitinophagales bacterium]|nr:Hsp20/alpha crystallin family protein [Chitinophagales bacterium]
MTLVKVKPVVKRFPTFSNDFDRLFNSVFANDFPATSTNTKVQPAANIIENEGNYRLELAAPGLEKGDFEIKVEKGILSISVNKDVKEGENEKYKRKEFGFYQFERSFRLPDFTDTSAIEAVYEQGILKVKLPRKAETAPKRIEIV